MQPHCTPSHPSPIVASSRAPCAGPLYHRDGSELINKVHPRTRDVISLTVTRTVHGDGQTSPGPQRLLRLVSRSTCPPISPSHPNSFVICTAVINTHTRASARRLTYHISSTVLLTARAQLCIRYRSNKEQQHTPPLHALITMMMSFICSCRNKK
jgi:hypothetical protein